jgi:hypothetical protein
VNITIEQLNQAEEYLRSKYIGREREQDELNNRILQSEFIHVIEGTAEAMIHDGYVPESARESLMIMVAHTLTMGIDAGTTIATQTD